MLSCQSATIRLTALADIRRALAKAVADPASRQSARDLKAKLEAGLVELSRELVLEITVADAINPYAEALKAAGLPANHPECAEKKEVKFNLDSVIEKHCARYIEQDLNEWAADIQSKKDILTEAVSTLEEIQKIEARIKAGMVPTVMPGRETQISTWQKALNNLKPVWMLNGVDKAFNNPYIYSKFAEKMTANSDPNNLGFFRSIPDRPYLIWTKPTKKVDASTVSMSFAEQQKKYQTMVQNNPLLYDATDNTPLEYAALQSTHTAEIKHQAVELKVDSTKLTITPLDDYHQSYCRFLSVGLFSGGGVPNAYFGPVGARLNFDGDNVGANSESGFRPAARS